jgi:hypothetical protein
MAVYNAWIVEYLNGSTWTAISNVQNLTCDVGRRLPTDQWPVSTASIRVWYPTGFDAPIANLTMATKIRFFAPGRSSTEPTWTGWVRDMAVEIGIPWDTTTDDGNADFLVIYCEGEGARIGRDGLNVRGDVLEDVNSYIEDDIGVTNSLVIRSDASTAFGLYNTISAPNDSYNLWEAVQQVAIYTSGRIIDGVRKKASGWTGTAGSTNDPGTDFKTGALAAADIATVAFSDTTNNSTNRIYDQFELDSLADNYFTSASLTGQTEVSTATYTATAIGATAPYRQFDTRAFGQNATRFQEVANYYANTFSAVDMAPSSISATTAAQHTQNLDTLGFSNLELAYLATKAVRITLRGTSYLCRIEGVSVTADLDQARFTYYISPTDDTGWFILDDADLGVLDQNRLGLY